MGTYSGAYGYDNRSRQQRYADEMTQTSLTREGLKNDLLRQEVEAGKTRGKQLAQLSSQYLDTWNKMLANSTSMFNTAAASVQQVLSNTNATMEQIDQQVGSLVTDINKNIANYREQFGGLQGEAVDTAMMELGVKRDLTSQMADLSRADTEGAAARAKADAGNEAASSRQQMADKLIAMGVDPTSGTGRAMMQRSMSDEALQKTFAANTARNAEKTRSATATAQGLQVIDPSKTAGIATNIAAGDRAMMQDRANVTMSGIGAKTALTKTQGDLTGTLADIASKNAATASQAGEFGASLLAESIRPRA